MSTLEILNEKIDAQTSLLVRIDERQEDMKRRLADGAVRMDRHETRITNLEMDRAKAWTVIKVLHVLMMAIGAGLSWLATHLPNFPFPR
jgi:hypothetical protein